MSDDLILYIFSFLGDEENLMNLKKTNKYWNKKIKFKHLTKLKITKENLYLLEYDLKNIVELNCSDNKLTKIPLFPELVRIQYYNNPLKMP